MLDLARTTQTRRFSMQPPTASIFVPDPQSRSSLATEQATPKHTCSCTAAKTFDPETQIIKIVVGVSKRTFHVHESVLRGHSRFFDAALTTHWREGQEGTANLPYDDTDIVDAYVRYLYSGRITYPEEPNAAYRTLAKLYVFGEKMLDENFRDLVVDCIVARTRCTETNSAGVEGKYFPIKDAVNIIYAGTAEDSHTRRLMVGLHFIFGNGSWMDRDNNDAEFLADLAERALELNVAGAASQKAAVRRELADGKPCSYHCHMDNCRDTP